MAQMMILLEILFSWKLKEAKSKWQKPWCLAGDFNIVRLPNERKGCVHTTPAMSRFSEFVEANELIDPPLVGGWFTWSNNREDPSLSRIDRFLLSNLGRILS